MGVDKKGGQWYNVSEQRRSYDAVEEIAQLEHLAYLSDSMLDEYAKEAE
jgi:hypothetical protein